MTLKKQYVLYQGLIKRAAQSGLGLEAHGDFLHRITLGMEGSRLESHQMPYADKFQLHIYETLAEQKRDFISQRTKAALQAAKAKGTRLGAPKYYLDVLAAARVEKAKREAEEVAGVILPLRKHGSSLRNICKVLNASGIRSSRGNSFHPSLVSRMLTSLGVAI